jgi:AmmeMemoRadiSam system protein A
MPCTEYSGEERAELLAIARGSIRQGVRLGEPLTVDIHRLPRALGAIRSAFVTLRRAGELRGCTGSLEPSEPLAVHVAEVACRTALYDPRFLPVRPEEVDGIDIEISVLSPLTEFAVASEADLLARLQPGVDGLVLKAGRNSATFLPKVWESLPHPQQFLSALKAKANLPADFWSNDIRLFRYRTETFSDVDAGACRHEPGPLSPPSQQPA